MGMLPTLILRKISVVCPSIAEGFPPSQKEKNSLTVARAPPPPPKKKTIYARISLYKHTNPTSQRGGGNISCIHAFLHSYYDVPPALPGLP